MILLCWMLVNVLLDADYNELNTYDSFSIWILRGLSEKQGRSRLSQISDMID
ncbi:Uncharacterised protein [uncultured archaeon]|nr:Uncharacterised protein [uncultured archaeon]